MVCTHYTVYLLFLKKHEVFFCTEFVYVYMFKVWDKRGGMLCVLGEWFVFRQCGQRICSVVAGLTESDAALHILISCIHMSIFLFIDIEQADAIKICEYLQRKT